MDNTNKKYIPDFPSPPGQSLNEILDAIGMSQAELSTRMGRPRKTINEIIKGKTAITPETALQLELVLSDTSASFWIRREEEYREALARLEQKEELSTWLKWLENVPYRELISLGWLTEKHNKIDQLYELLQYFGVVSPAQWDALWGDQSRVAFRQSTVHLSDRFAIAAWIRKGEKDAQEIQCSPYDEGRFLKALERIREMTSQKPQAELYTNKLVEICQGAGVAVSIVPRLKGSKIFGATQWLTPRKALIILSSYYAADDIFWFTFFHEAAHLILHSKKRVFVHSDSDEEEASKFAADFLIRKSDYLHFIRQESTQTKYDEPFSYEAIEAFARGLGIAPSIVVGRLKHDEFLEWPRRNSLRAYLEWNEDGELMVNQPKRMSKP